MTELSDGKLCQPGQRSLPRAFQCRLCGKSFMKNEHLVRHVRSHTKERPFKCPDCGNNFSRHDVLKRHQRDVKCRRPRVRHPVVADGPVRPHSPTMQLETGISHSPGAITPEATSLQPGQGMLTEAVWHGQMDDTRQCLDQTTRTIEMGNPEHLQWDSGLLLPSGAGGIDEQFPSWVIDPDLHDDILEMNFSPLDDSLIPQPVPPDIELLQVEKIHRLWFSRLPDTPNQILYPERVLGYTSNPVSEPMSPYSGNTDIDDRCRQNIQNRLQIMSFEPTVPSVNLLNVLIRLYFAKVHPVFPLIHVATFRPSKENSSLLIAMCAIGSLLIGSENGLRQGIHLFERVHKSTLVNWERLMAKNQDTMVTIIQCAILAQIFGLLSGSPNLLLTVDAFHGPPIAWARHMRLHRSRPSIQLDPNDEGRRLDESWRMWARNEELLRVAHGLYIVDGELASILRHEPFQNFESYSFSFASSDRTFMALNSQDWREKYLAEMQHRQYQHSQGDCSISLSEPHGFLQVPETSQFTAYAVLKGIDMEILRYRSRIGKTARCLEEFNRPLSHFRQRFLNVPVQNVHDPLQLQVLWHAVHMNLSTDFDLLEKAIGRDGLKVSVSERAIITEWANSNEGQICVLHGLMSKRYVQGANLRSELAIHTPRVIFQAGIALFCYIVFGSPDHLFPPLLLTTASPNDSESFLSGVDRPALLIELRESGIGNSYSLKMMLFEMIDLLQQTGHWEISRKYAAILTAACSFAFDHKL